VGSHQLPVPGYPGEAYAQHIEGTVMMRVSFDASGGVSNAEVVDSSGSALLDSSTRHFILENWHEVDMAGQTQTVPIQYAFPH
jgi:TonB family protein